MERIANDPAMMSIWGHEATAVDTADMGDAAMRILFALSHHHLNCPGPNAREIGVRVTLTTTTRNGFGTIRGQNSDIFDQVLRVRPEFESLARQNIRHYSDSVFNNRFVAVRDLISQETCDSPRLRHLEVGLARAAGVSLSAPPLPDATMGSDWRGFVFSCMNASVPDPLADRSMAGEFCNVAEAILVTRGDPNVYRTFSENGFQTVQDWSQTDQDAFNAEITDVFRNDQAVRQRFIDLRNAGAFDQ
ncbi:MAG: hypothetical protein AAF762_10605 [Pseudomonadota bacterium]